MQENKPREGDYNFIIWKNGDEIIIDPWDQIFPPSIYTNGEWVVLAEGYGKEN
jgi:hypothetical protein